ncbi:MAG: metallothionein [Cyanobacteria bacterium J06627_8]
MATATQLKCACEPCSCIVDTSKAVQKGDKYYCSDACASGHADGAACAKSGCGCSS